MKRTTLRSDDAIRNPKQKQIEPPVHVTIVRSGALSVEEQGEIFNRILQILRADPGTDER